MLCYVDYLIKEDVHYFMKLLVFEYSCVCLDDSLISEGYYMLKGILEDLNSFSFFDTYYLINEKIKDLNYDNCTCIYLDNDLKEWLCNNSSYFDYCLFVAPEDNLIQYELTKLLEDNGVKLLCSNSEASRVCSSKFLTYEIVPDDVLKIKTLCYNLSNINFLDIEDTFPDFNFIVKPDDRTSSDLIFHISNPEELNEVLNIYETNNVKSIIFQEYINGDAISVSAICNEDYINCISVNSQELSFKDNRFEYNGCVTPIDVSNKNEIFLTSHKIIKSIPGLKGFIGIDYIILDDKIYFVEVNSRITTPFIVLKEKCENNLTEHIINLLVNNKCDKVSFSGKGEFNKEKII